MGGLGDDVVCLRCSAWSYPWVRPSLMAGWVDWSPLETIAIELGALEISGEVDCRGVIVQSGINDSSDRHEAEYPTISVTARPSTVAALSTFPSDQVVGAHRRVYSPSTLPAEAMHASIVDFAVLDLRLAAHSRQRSGSRLR